MSRSFHCQIEVRGYELDSFGHVNHGIYVSYLEHARWRMLQDAGITLQTFQEQKCWPVIAHIELNYLRPTYLGDILDIESHITDQKKTSSIFEQKIIKKGETILKARVQVVTVNEKGKPCALPPGLAKLWSARLGDSGEGVAP